MGDGDGGGGGGGGGDGGSSGGGGKLGRLGGLSSVHTPGFLILADRIHPRGKGKTRYQRQVGK